ncbi:MAG: transposase, partial [Deferrisomatales bacterium]
MTTLAQQWIDEGKEQGLRQGLQQKAHAAVIEVIETRFGVVPQSVVETVGRVDQGSVLSMLLKRAVVVDSLAVFR